MSVTGPLPFWLFELVLTGFMSISAWSMLRVVRQLDEIERRVRAVETRLAVAESTLHMRRIPYVYTEAHADG